MNNKEFGGPSLVDRLFRRGDWRERKIAKMLNEPSVSKSAGGKEMIEKAALAAMVAVPSAGAIQAEMKDQEIGVPGNNDQVEQIVADEVVNTKPEQPVKQENQEGEYDPSKVYEVPRLPLTEKTKANIESYKEAARMFVESESGENVYNIEIPLEMVNGEYQLPFESDGDRFVQMRRELLGWANDFERADGHPSEAGDFSIFLGVNGDEVSMVLRLNQDIEFDVAPLKKGTLWSVDFDHLTDDGFPRTHYIEPVVPGVVATLLHVDETFLENMAGSGLPATSFPGEGARVLVLGERLSSGKITPVQIALGNRAYIWRQRWSDTGTPTPEGAEIVEGSALPTPEPAKFGLRPEAGMPLESVLNSWLDGSYQVPDSRRFFQDEQLVTSPYLSSELMDPAEKSAAPIVGVLLGIETVDGVLIAYLGFEDKSKNRFFVPFDLGDIDNGLQVGFAKSPARAVAPTGRVDAEILTPSDLRSRLPGLIGEFVKISVYLSTAEYPEPPADQKEFFDQVIGRVGGPNQEHFLIGQEVNEFLYNASIGNVDLNTAPEIVNKNIDQYSLEIPTTSDVLYAEGMGE